MSPQCPPGLAQRPGPRCQGRLSFTHRPEEPFVKRRPGGWTSHSSCMGPDESPRGEGGGQGSTEPPPPPPTQAKAPESSPAARHPPTPLRRARRGTLSAGLCKGREPVEARGRACRVGRPASCAQALIQLPRSRALSGTPCLGFQAF